MQIAEGEIVDRAQIAESLALVPEQRVDRLIGVARLVLAGRAAVGGRRSG